MIPDGWIETRFIDLCVLQRGFDLPVKSRLSGNIKVIASNGPIDTHNEAKVRGPGVVTGRSGSIGKVTFFDDDFWPLNTTLYVKDFCKNYPKFVYYFIEHIKLERFATGTGVPTLNRNDVHKARIVLPPLPEQKRIAEILTSVDDAIQATEKVIEQTKKVKQGLLQELLTRGIGHTKFKKTEIGEIPESWSVTTLSDIAKVERGKFSPRPRNDPQYYGGDIPFIQTGDVSGSNGTIKSHTQTLNEKGLSVSKLFPKGTIFVTIAANIGDFAVSLYDCACPDSLVGIQAEKINPEYLFYFLTTTKSLLDSKATQNAQKNINLQVLKPLKIAVPSNENEQEEIAKILKSLDSSILDNQANIQKLVLQKNGLMQDLLTGRVRVRGVA